MNAYTYSTHLCLTQAEMEATAGDMGIMLEGLGKNILKHLGNIELGKSVRIFLHDPVNKTIGGIAGDLFGGWIYISLLWVDENNRNRGFGTELVKRLEAEARQLGCSNAHLDTYSFEARPFYERAGYEVFARLDDYPVGHSKYFLKKALA
ncbi:MAG TPA: GNAT family N-acetyltransferase [Anaerolineales bacterium]|nr:GNAT family N-acetyltransferase [Anaerolineales bacterium]